LDINASYSHSSLALPALQAQLRENEFKLADWKVISGTINSDASLCLLDIEKYLPHIILSTAWLFNHTFILNLLSKYKRINPATLIILGGPEFSGNNSDYLLRNTFIDAVFRGEGEDSFPLLLNSLVTDRNWENIPGMCWIDKKGIYKDNGEGIVSDFSKLISPEKSIFFNWDKPFIQLETSRGCFNSCSFCVSGGCRKIQNISLEDVRKRLENISIKGIKEVRILDRTFNSNSRRAIQLLEIFNSFHNKIKFHLEIHPALLTNELKTKLSELPARILHLEAGLQSLDSKVLSACMRVGDSKEAIDGIKYIVSLNKFELHVDLIAGLPSYTYKMVIKDILFLIPIGLDEIQLELLKLLPGTDLREKSNTYGIVFSSFPPYEVLKTNTISPNELYRLSILSKILDIWYNKSIWRDAFKKIVTANYNMLELFLEYILNNNALNNNLGLESKGIILSDFCNIYNKESESDVAFAWIEAGMSLKKGPGKLAKQWIRGSSVENNPILEEKNFMLNYFFIKDVNREFWFAYDKREKKEKPAKSLMLYMTNTNNS